MGREHFSPARAGFNLLAFLGWTSSSFACHFFAKNFIQCQDRQSLTRGLLITLAQLFGMSAFLHVTKRRIKDQSQDIAQWLVILFHALGTLATNLSLSQVQVWTTMAIKILEPISTCLMHWLVFGNRVPPHFFFTLPLICGGVGIFLINSEPFYLPIWLGITSGLAANLFYGLRNIHIKTLKNQDHGWEPVAPSLFHLGILSSLLLVGSQSHLRLLPLMLSSVFHILYTYLSTSVVLKSVSVITHTILNVLKRVAIVAMFVLTGQSYKSLSNWMGLSIAAIGLGAHLWFQRSHSINKLAKTWTLGTTLGAVLVSGLMLTLFVLVHPWRGCGSIRLHAPFDPNVTVDWSQWQREPPMINLTDDSPGLQKDMLIRDQIIESMIEEQLDFFQPLLAKFPKLAIIDLADFENKGDPAIAMGELTLLKHLKVDLIYYTMTSHAISSVGNAHEVIGRYPVEEVLILFHGGGNIFAYEFADQIRAAYFEAFPGHHMLMLPQSVWFSYPEHQILKYAKMYEERPNLTMTFRDPLSMERARKVMPKANIAMVPDMAFQIGSVPRFRPPVFDILYHKRSDCEHVEKAIPRIPRNVSLKIDDWIAWSSPKLNDMESTIAITTNGFSFLQRGRVVITDRLHGHILSTLSGIPHVLLDSKGKKISAYYHHWTKDIPFVQLASSIEEALEMALAMIAKYDESLPATDQSNGKGHQRPNCSKSCSHHERHRQGHKHQRADSKNNCATRSGVQVKGKKQLPDKQRHKGQKAGQIQASDHIKFTFTTKHAASVMVLVVSLAISVGRSHITTLKWSGHYVDETGQPHVHLQLGGAFSGHT
eukprot:maker-scaffold105_size367834-snap-gene-1.17 protein:Tk10180 transcript:maker-scaffold105_size367834-snap-gene-1.17-mRNA-1 annotation:"hypothetical protein LOTGIDRAFT_173604"